MEGLRGVCRAWNWDKGTRGWQTCARIPLGHQEGCKADRLLLTVCVLHTNTHASAYLVVSVVASHHQHLLEQLRALRQRVEVTRLQHSTAQQQHVCTCGSSVSTCLIDAYTHSHKSCKHPGLGVPRLER